LEDLETLAPFVAALDLFGLVVEADLFVLTCCLACAARIAKGSCLLEQPVFSKIRVMIGEVSSSSSSMVEREGFKELLDVVASEREGPVDIVVDVVLVVDEQGACFKFKF